MASRWPKSTTSRRYGQVGVGDATGAGEGVSVRVNVSANGIVKMTDKVTGLLRGGAFRDVMVEVNERAAKQIQRGMVEQLNKAVSERRRPQRPGRRLEMSIMDYRNRDVTVNSFIVGRPSWLDQSPAALYWRRIEEGDQTTFDAPILFSIEGQGGKLARPRLGSREHNRMPQGRGPFVQNIGPFPQYEFSRGGRRVLREFPFKREYKKALEAIGLTLD